MENVKVFRLNEYDGVAAETLEQAREFYMKVTGMNEEEAFSDYAATEMPLEYEVWADENKTGKQSFEEIIRECWEGKPFIAFSSGW